MPENGRGGGVCEEGMILIPVVDGAEVAPPPPPAAEEVVAAWSEDKLLQLPIFLFWSL